MTEGDSPLGSPRIVLVAAVARNWVIGCRQELPWHLSADLERFKKLTLDHMVVMGRRTYESIGRPLPRRTNLVLSRTLARPHPEVVVLATLDAAIEHAREERRETLLILGGEQVYGEALPRADELWLTWVEAEPEGDALFPRFDREHWIATKETFVPADDKNDYDSLFQRLVRAEASGRER